MRHTLALLILTAGALVTAPTQASAAKFVASLSSLKVTARAGQVFTHSHQLTLDPSERPTRFRFHVEDWWRSEDGMQSFYAAPGTLQHSCGKWVTLNPVEVEVQPGATLTTRLTVNVPREISAGGYWCVLTVDEIPNPLDTPTGVGARFVASVSTGIFINIDPVQRAVEFVDVKVGASEASVTLRNTGTTPSSVEGKFEFTRPGETEPVAVVPFPRGTVLTEPVVTATFRAVLPDRSLLPSGRYMVRAIIDIGLDHFLGVEREANLVRDDPDQKAP